MTARAQHAADFHVDIADHRAHADALVAAYRDAHAKLGDPAAAFACAVGAAYTTLCHRRTAQVLAAAVQMLVEREGADVEIDELTDERDQLDGSLAFQTAAAFDNQAEADQLRAALEEATGRQAQLADILRDILGVHWESGHPGYAATRSPWFEQRHLSHWRRRLPELAAPVLPQGGGSR